MRMTRCCAGVWHVVFGITSCAWNVISQISPLVEQQRAHDQEVDRNRDQTDDMDCKNVWVWKIAGVCHASRATQS